MTESRFTKGPWRASKRNPRVINNEGGDLQIARVFAEYSSKSSRHRQSEGEAKANAHLIAAAPCLYEVASQFIPDGIAIGNSNVPDDLIIPLDVTMGELRRLEAALAKARGE